MGEDEARRWLTQLQRTTHRALASVKARLSRLRCTAASRDRPPRGNFSRTRRNWLRGGARPFSSTVLEEGILMAEASPLVPAHPTPLRQTHMSCM